MSSLMRATSVVLFFNLVSKILGFLRDATLAAYFGASQATDTYLVAYTLPYALQAVFGMAFLLVMVPLLTDYLARNKQKEAYHIARSVLIRLGVVLVVLVILGLVFTSSLTRMLAPGFSSAQLQETVSLTRIMLPSIVFMGLGMLFSGMLNGEKKFALVASAPALVNIIIIASIVYSSARMGIRGVAWGTLLGYWGFFLVLWIGVHRRGFRWMSQESFDHKVAAGTFQDILPVTMSVAVNQIFLMVGRAYGSQMTAGTIASFEFASRLINLPIGVFTAAIVTASYPLLTETVIRNDAYGLSKNLLKSLRVVLLMMLPAAIGMVVLREPLIQVVFQRGAFDVMATKMTAETLIFFALAMVAISCNMLLTRAYYAMRQYKMPLLSGGVAILVQIFMSYLLVDSFQHHGLAASYAFANFTYSFLLFWGYRKMIVPGLWKAEMVAVGKFFIASCIMGWTVLSAKGFVESWIPGDPSSKWWVLFVATGVGLLVYFIGLWVLDYDDWHIRLFQKRSRRREKS